MRKAYDPWFAYKGDPTRTGGYRDEEEDLAGVEQEEAQRCFENQRRIDEQVAYDRYCVEEGLTRYYVERDEAAPAARPLPSRVESMHAGYDPDDPYDNQRMLGYER